jgi:single-stranded-DNA-specific exonuclease
MACRDLAVVAAPRRVGKSGEHLQLQVRQGGRSLKCIAFGQGELADRLAPDARIDLAFEPALNEFNGYTNVELEVKDVQFPERALMRQATLQPP